MTIKSEYLIDLIFKKLKNYKSKEIFLEKENLKKFIFSLLKGKWVKKNLMKTVIFKWIHRCDYV